MKNILWGLLLLLCGTLSALNYPGTAPSTSLIQSNKSTGLYTISNNVISITFKKKSGMIYLESITNKITGGSFKQENSPIFELKFKGGSSDNWEIVSPISVHKIAALPHSASKGKCYKGKAIEATLKNKKTGLLVKWIGEIRDSANYLKSTIVISSDQTVKLNEVRMNCNIKIPGMKQIGDKKLRGMPIVGGNFFLGLEVPFFKNKNSNGKISQGFASKLEVKKGVQLHFSSVIGVYPKGQLRRGILYYIERERARSYSQFLLYNCWFDLERKVSEKGMMDRIKKIDLELRKKRGVKVVSYVVDDGYDDYKRGFWVFDKKKFPNGFAKLANYLKGIDSHLGVWLSPSGGYSGNKERHQRAKEIGINSLDLANPAYYKWFLDRHMKFIKEEGINFFKWDRLGGGINGHFMGLMDIAEKLRTENPELFIATTVGTWPSLFWLTKVDCTWRGGQDVGFSGVGDNREKWITYRDGITYQQMQRSEFIFPLTAMMNHGVLFANGHPFVKKVGKGKKDIRYEVRSYFAGGYAMQELYITPSILGDEQWNAIAESAKWAKKCEDLLVDAHFIGGDPLKLEVYGFASWNNNNGTLSLRNPSDKPQEFSFDIKQVFELPKNAKRKYTLKSPYSDQRIKKITVESEKNFKIKLNPFEVLVFDTKTQK